MGLREPLAQVGAKVGDGSEYYRMDGTTVGKILTTDSSGWNGLYGMHRADLLRVLGGRHLHKPQYARGTAVSHLSKMLLAHS